MRSQRLDTQKQLLRFHCFETLEGDDIVLVHGQKMSTDARTKTDRTTNDENVHGDTEKRAYKSGRVLLGTKAPRGDKSGRVLLRG
jgi:hypothetical protein